MGGGFTCRENDLISEKNMLALCKMKKHLQLKQTLPALQFTSFAMSVAELCELSFLYFSWEDLSLDWCSGFSTIQSLA